MHKPSENSGRGSVARAGKMDCHIWWSQQGSEMECQRRPGQSCWMLNNTKNELMYILVHLGMNVARLLINLCGCTKHCASRPKADGAYTT